MAELKKKVSRTESRVDKIFFVIDCTMEGGNAVQDGLKAAMMERNEHVYEDDQYCIVRLQ